jgi:phosphoribosylpyrophosphate synthetase
MLDQPIKDKVIHALKEMIDDGAEAQFAKANLKIYTTNSIPREAQYLKENASWLTQIPMDELLADAIHQAFVPGGSISKLLL